MSDERNGLPSASAASRYAACLGSYQLERRVVEQETSADAHTGNRIHAALALEPVTDDGDLQPANWYYTVSEVVDGVSQSYALLLVGAEAFLHLGHHLGIDRPLDEALQPFDAIRA